MQNEDIEPVGEPPLNMIVTYDESVVRPDGVTQTTRYQERIIRSDGRVWTERILDPRVELPRSHGGHMHDWSTAIRLITHASSTKDGMALRFDFVIPEDREIVYVAPVEYDSVGFYPTWEDVAHLVTPADLENLSPSPRPSSVPGARWLEFSSEKGFARVLWSDRLRVALEVETGKADGTVLRRRRVDLQAMPEVFPWTQLDGYALKDVNDFRD